MATAVTSPSLTTSNNNPFRTPALTPAPTGTSSSSAPAPATAELRHSPGPPSINATTSESATRNDRVRVPDFPDEEPPAYTPSADVYQGESTIEYGPRRPFQNPPAAAAPATVHHGSAPPQPQATAPSLWRQLSAQIDQIASQITGPGSSLGLSPTHRPPQPPPNWAGYPGLQRQDTSGPGYAPPPGPPPFPTLNTNTAPNPNAQTPPSLPPRRDSAPNGSSSTSDFARDFYAAGAGEFSEALQGSRSHSTPAAPVESSASGSGQSDNRPTTTPTPGRPLLRDGKLLVYPKGHMCEKCNNIGFKHADPSHPCRKCWSKYSKPFSGPLAYAYSSNTPFEGSSSFQRPLPSFRPPHRPSPAPAPVPVPAPVPAPFGGFPHPPPNQQGRMYHTLSPYSFVPHSSIGQGNTVVYRAGDPRMGGTLCWRCEGTGTVSFMLFDETTCETCGGIGRILR